MTTCLISVIFLGTSAAQAIATDDLVEQWRSVVIEPVCLPEPTTRQQLIGESAVTSRRGKGKISGKRIIMMWLNGKSIACRCTTQFYCFPYDSDDSAPKSSTRSRAFVRRGNPSYFAFRTERQQLWCCAKRWGQLTQGNFFRSSRNSTEVNRWDRCPFIILREIQNFFAC